MSLIGPLESLPIYTIKRDKVCTTNMLSNHPSDNGSNGVCEKAAGIHDRLKYFDWRSPKEQVKK